MCFLENWCFPRHNHRKLRPGLMPKNSLKSDKLHGVSITTAQGV